MTYRSITIYNAIAGLDATIPISKRRMERLRMDPEARKELQAFLGPKMQEARNYVQAAPVVHRFIPRFAALSSATKFSYNGVPQDPEVIMQTLQRDLGRYRTSLTQLEWLSRQLCEMDRVDNLPSEAGTETIEYTIRVERPRT